MRLTIFGASGGVGRHLVEQAVEAGHTVRAIVRRSADLPASVEQRVIDDVTSAGDVRGAIEDADVVLSALGQRRKNPANAWSKIISPIDLNERFARALVEAVGSNAAKPRVIVVSAGGAGDSRSQLSGIVRFMFDHSNIGVAYRDLEKMEAVFASSDLDWCAVRPTTLNNKQRSGRVREVSRYGLRDSISRADVAWWMLEQIKERPRTSRTPMIANG